MYCTLKYSHTSFSFSSDPKKPQAKNWRHILRHYIEMRHKTVRILCARQEKIGASLNASTCTWNLEKISSHHLRVQLKVILILLDKELYIIILNATELGFTMHNSNTQICKKMYSKETDLKIRSLGL